MQMIIAPGLNCFKRLTKFWTFIASTFATRPFQALTKKLKWQSAKTKVTICTLATILISSKSTLGVLSVTAAMVLPTCSLVHPQRPHLRTKAGKIFLHFSPHLFQQTFLDRRTMKIFPQQRNIFLITILPNVHFEVQTFPSLLATVMPRALLLSLSLWTPILASQSWWSPGEPLPLYDWQQKGNGRPLDKNFGILSFF